MEINETYILLNSKLSELEKIIGGDVISYTGQISPLFKRKFRGVIEGLQDSKGTNKKITIILTTTGGNAEFAEDMVYILRKYYEEVNFIIPNYAMSAGTILVMSGNNIYMDYSSALGPIDPQILDLSKGGYVPASGYLDRVNELINKEMNGYPLTQSELNVVIGQDIGKLKYIEQLKSLSETLVAEWLEKYKFSNLKISKKEKTKKAEEIARLLGDNNVWHTHGRSIDINKARDILGLEIIDFGENEELNLPLQSYYAIIYQITSGKDINFIHSRNYI